MHLLEIYFPHCGLPPLKVVSGAGQITAPHAAATSVFLGLAALRCCRMRHKPGQRNQFSQAGEFAERSSTSP